MQGFKCPALVPKLLEGFSDSILVSYRKPSSDGEDLEGEEEFYYNEIEVPLNGEFAVHVGNGSFSANPSLFSTSAPPSSAVILPSTLADHMDMARPPHENPEYNFAHHSRNFAALRPSPAHSQPPRRNPAHLASYPPPPPPPPQPSAFSSITAAVPIAIPVTNLAFARSAVSPIQLEPSSGHALGGLKPYFLSLQPPAHSSSHPPLAHHHHGGGKYIRLSPKPSLSSASASSAAAATATAIAAAAASNNLLTIQQQQQHHGQHPQVAPPAQQHHQHAPPTAQVQQVKSSPIR